FVHEDGSPYRAGERLVQKDLAANLALIAEQGPDAFYRGPIAAAIAAASAANRGLLTRDDFAGYAVKEAPPVACPYRGRRVLSAPPPAGGVIVCELLNILSGWDLAAGGRAAPQTVHLFAEAMRHAYVDRNNALGDPGFVADRRARPPPAGRAGAVPPARRAGQAAAPPAPRPRPPPPPADGT